jgi:hypothetical protein
MIPAFAHCSACSEGVGSAFAADGAAFVRQVCDDSSVLDKVSGVLRMHEDLISRAQSGDACDWDEGELSSEEGSV